MKSKKKHAESTANRLDAALERFANSLVLNDTMALYRSPYREATINAIVESLPKYIDQDDAQQMLLIASLQLMSRAREMDGGSLLLQQPELRKDFVSQLRADIDSLPHSFTIRLALPVSGIDVAHRFPLTESIDLVTGSEMLRQPPRSPKDGIRDTVIHSTYIEIRSKGYSSPTHTSPAFSACFSQVKQLLFGLINADLFERHHRAEEAVATFRNRTLGFTYTIILPEDMRRCLSSLAANEQSLFAFHAPGQGLLAGYTSMSNRRRPATDAEFIAAISANLEPIRKFLALNAHAEFEPIGAAIEWYQDSTYADNQTFAYLAACIGLEALLGPDGFTQGMTKRLQDRYAFMLGTSRAERQQLSEELGAVLEARGSLVHAKKAKLLPHERPLLSKAQEILRRVINHEIKLLTARNHAKSLGSTPPC